MACATCLFALALALSRIPPMRVLGIVVPVYVLVAFTVLANALLFRDGALSFSMDGLVRGCYFGTRVLLLVWASLIVCFTSTSTQLTEALNSFLKPLRKLHVPTDDIAMVFSIALRFIPVTAEEYMRIRDAQWSRCAPLDEGGALVRAKAHSAILIPMFVGLFRRADDLAIAMDVRCYGMPGVERTSLSENRLTLASVTCLVIGSLIFICLALFL